MFEIKKSFVAVLVVSAATILGGCSAEQANDPAGTPAEGETDTPPAAPALSADGLTVERSDADGVAGRLERNGTMIGFQITRDGGARHVVITDRAGAKLFESTLKDGVDASSFLDGRARMVGAMGVEPERSGDTSAITAFAELPEGRLVLELRDALEAAGVDRDLYRLARPDTADAQIRPNVYTSWSGGWNAWPDNTWYRVPQWGSVAFFSWGFWSTTAIYTYGSHGLQVNVNGQVEYFSSSTSTTYYRQWWGAYVTIKNIRVPLCSVYWPYTCQDPSAWVLVK